MTLSLLCGDDHHRKVCDSPRDRQGRRGLKAGTTLVELVVAIAILVVVMGAVMPVFTHIRRSWDTWENSFETIANPNHVGQQCCHLQRLHPIPGQ